MTRSFAAQVFVLALAIAGCGPSNFRKEVTETRTVPPAPAIAAPQNAAPQHAAAQDGPLAWQLPAGWDLQAVAQ